MKKFLLIFIVVIEIFFGLFNNAEARSSRSSSSDVHVNGYFRANGTYVAPYYRSAPDGIKANNYSCIDYGNCGGETPIYTTPVRTCSDVYGWNSISTYDGKCTCMSGYIWDDSGTSCIPKPTPTEACHSSFGWGSEATYDGKCTCMSGYIWDDSGANCILKPIAPLCGTNSTYANNKCACNPGYEWEYPNDAKNFDCKVKRVCDITNGYRGADNICYCNDGYTLSGNLCIKNKTPSELCQTTYGSNSLSDGIKNSNGGYNCSCKVGYVWATDQKSCELELKNTTGIIQVIALTEREKQLQTQTDKWFSKLQIKYGNISDANEKKQKYENLRDALYKYQGKLTGDKKFILEYLISLVKKELGDTDLSLGDLFGY